MRPKHSPPPDLRGEAERRRLIGRLLAQKQRRFEETRVPGFAENPTPKRFFEMATELFEMVTSGKVKIEIGKRYPLADAVQAHRDLEGRATTGSVVLTL